MLLADRIHFISRVRGLEQLVRAKNLRTIGDLSGLTETEVNNLPIRSPKVLTMRRALQTFSDSKTMLETKSAGVKADKESGKGNENTRIDLYEEVPVVTGGGGGQEVTGLVIQLL